MYNRFAYDNRGFPTMLKTSGVVSMHYDFDINI
ncbi:hypothetical protein M2138_001534 [Dysgonomonadaceae bacterium PH5-43]|nr:hypothetical protein [Dysgonomonadaceae bacterium PH5-43]